MFPSETSDRVFTCTMLQNNVYFHPDHIMCTHACIENIGKDAHQIVAVILRLWGWELWTICELLFNSCWIWRLCVLPDLKNYRYILFFHYNFVLKQRPEVG